MMDNIQAIIADRQYQGALEDQNTTIRPYKPFPKPSHEQYNQLLHDRDLSLRAILDSPISVFEFKQFVSSYPHFPVVIDFLVQYERIRELETPSLNAAKALMEIALQLPPIYEQQVDKLRVAFRREFGPITFANEKAQNFVGKRIQSLDMDTDEEYFPPSGVFDSLGNEQFPDSTAPETEKEKKDENRMSNIFSPYGKPPAFGGFLHRNKRAMKEGIESSINTEILRPTNELKIISDRRAAEVEAERKSKETIEAFDDDFDDRIRALRTEEEEERVNRKQKAINVFSDIAEVLRNQAEELLTNFKANSAEFKEMINILWFAEQKIEVNDFLMFRDLGRGAFGVVSAAKTKSTGTLTAIKCLNKKLIKGKKARRLVAAEKAILQVLGDNPSNFTVWLKYSFQDKDYFYMAIPLCTGGDLAFHLRNKFNFSLSRAKFHFAEILEGIDHLHSLSIVYRDMKPENVIFDSEGHARISDMGLAIQTEGMKIRGKAGTPGYWAPEVITNQPYSFSADHWSLGCVFYEMLTGRCPFSSTNTKLKDRNEGTLHWNVKFPKNVRSRNEQVPFPEEAKPVILGLLDRNRTRRMGAKEVREHKLFQDIEWLKIKTREVPVPWKPKNGQIYAPDQIELDFASKDKAYKKLKILPEDEIELFDYTSKYSHEMDIVNVLETRKAGKLEYDHQYDSPCCYCM